MRGPVRWVVLSSATLLILAASAAAGEVRPTKLTVKEGVPGATASVAFQGQVVPADSLTVPTDLEFRCGDYAEALAVTASAKSLSYKAEKGATGVVVKFNLSRRSGKFSLAAKDIPVGSLDFPLPVTLAIGGQRMELQFPLREGRTTHAWKKGDDILAVVRARVFGVGHDLGNTVLTPVSNTTFVRGNAGEQEATVVGDSVRTDSLGVATFTVAFSNVSVLGRLDMGQVLGTESSFTSPGRVAVTPGEDGEVEAAVFVHDQDGATGILAASRATVLDVPGTAGAPSGTLRVPSRGAVSSDGVGISFTPVSFGAELPAPLEDGYRLLAGAEVRTSTPVLFQEEFLPTVELGLPSDLRTEREFLAQAEIRLLQWRSGAWEDRGPGVYDPDTNRLVPDPSGTAGLAEGTPVVYAARVDSEPGSIAKGHLRVAPEQGSIVRGHVKDDEDLAVQGLVVLTRTGSSISKSLGDFAVPRSTFTSSGMEILQFVGEGTLKARVLSSDEAGAGDLEIRLTRGAPLDQRVGVFAGTVYESDGTTPSPGAKVTFSLAGSVRGLVLDDGGTPDDFADDALSVPDLSEFGVTAHAWSVLFPGESEPFVVEGQTGRTVSPRGLLLDAETQGKPSVEGAYTVQASFVVPNLGPYILFAGFRMASGESGLEVADVQIPASWQGTASEIDIADAAGAYTVNFRAPLGLPLIATATSADGARTARVPFQHSNEVDLDFTFSGPPPPAPPPPPPPPPPLPVGWTSRASLPTPLTGASLTAYNGNLYAFGGNANGPTVASLWIYDPLTDSWAAGTPMGAARSNLSTAEVKGSIYAIGGYAVGPTATVEEYNPLSNTWMNRRDLPTARYLMAVAVLNGKIYTLGGQGASGVLKTVEVYDPLTNSWLTAPDMPTARNGAVAAAVDGKIYVAGGSNGTFSLDTVEVYDPATAKWSTARHLLTARAYLAAGVIQDSVFAVGGVDGTGSITRAVEMCYPPANTWIAQPAMPTARDSVAAAALGGSVYVLGGMASNTPAALDVYTPVSLPPRWKTKTSMSTKRSWHGAVGYNGKLYVVGGTDSSGGATAVLEVYDPSTDSWATKAPMPTARAALGFAEVGGLLYAIGGYGSSATNSACIVEEYDPSSNAWKSRTPLSQRRYGATVAALNGKIYVCGGDDATSTRNRVDVYDPGTDSWGQAANMPGFTIWTCGAAVGGKLFVVDWSTVLVFDPGSNSWTNASGMPTPRNGAGVGVIDNEIYVFGGNKGGNSPFLDVMEIFNPSDGMWRTGLPMPTRRMGCAGAVVDGRLLAAGGLNGTYGNVYLDTLESYESP